MNTPDVASSLARWLSLAFAAGAFLLGWALHSEEYAAFWIIFAICCLRVALPAALPTRWPAIRFAIDLTALCLGFVLGFWVGRDRWWYLHRVVEWTAMSWMALIVLGSPIAWGLNQWAFRRCITGPYCRGCRYHLKGVADFRCPECGRPFTLKELGVSEVDLRAGA